MLSRAWMLAAALLMAGSARAQDLAELLADGPVALVKSNATGRFDHATAVIDIKATPAEVWATATDFSNYRYFLPKVVKSELLRRSATEFDVDFVIDVPFKNSKYTVRYDLDPDHVVIHGHWLKGDLRDSYSEWRILPSATGTRLFYTAAVRGLPGLVTTFEDKAQTVTKGINVVTALSVVEAVKRRVELHAAGAHADGGL